MHNLALLLVGIALGAVGMYFAIRNNPKTEAQVDALAAKLKAKLAK